ncbi:hypothetical protein RFN29_25755 [Mesorhizobium sp. VK22B]|uniref:Uncharacterized protein n=1 Tax=Mesorhizobium captivum TaxID=3072319 RepID=A0ABU4Z6R9_9HYPH|nr:hypothetical protein [Mesorhizobium sp. VK22B]MDX8494968.1 hypothetical protein [Mesorhizobium sp. VK22B]
MVSTSAYYAVDFFYRPLPVRIAMTLDYASGGYVLAEESDPEPKANFEGKITSRPPFSFVPAIDIGASVNWRSPQGTTRVQWSALSTPTKFDAEVSLYGGCWDGTKLPQNPAVYRLTDIRNVEFWIDSGLFQFDLLNDQQSSGTFKVTPERIVSFSTSKGEDGKSIELQHLVHESATLSYSSSSPALTYFAIAAPFSEDGDAIQAASTTFHLKVDGDDRQIKLETQNKTSRDKKLACRPIPSSPTFAHGRINMDNTGVLVGALVKITARPESRSYTKQTQALQVIGKTGWLTIKGIKPDALNQVPTGHAELVAADGVMSFDVNGASDTIRPTDYYTAIGDFDGSFDDTGRIHFDGIAQRLWKNQIRANPTKWESTGWGERGLLITALTALFGVFSRSLVLRYKGDVKFEL